jgi:hypothetical protein
MDNGLIFPYPRRSVHAEPCCANSLMRGPFGGSVDAGDLVGSRQAMG